MITPVIYDDAPLRERVTKCLQDDFKHNAIKQAQEALGSKRSQLVAEMPEWENLREAAKVIRQHVTDNLDYYLKEFVENTTARGNKVHFAPTADDALCEILDIFAEHNATSCVKSKSMMTEEMGLNSVLEEATIKVVETDCAEHIIQTAEDKPSHIVVPGLHFTRKEIAELYRQKKGYTGSDVPEEITHFLRDILREEFLTADIGIRGCNFAVAETGSVTLVTNEGNGRMIGTCPKTQIIVLGIDRLVPDLESLDVMCSLLARNAVGAKMTAYFCMDSGPARADEGDGPTDVHIVIMDNGRSDLIDTDFEDMLRCMRCGACLNTCPVYRHITGHGYGSIYPGPMGIIMSANLEGYDNIGSMPYACTLCGACSEDCPSKIPLHEMIRQHRINMVEEGRVPAAEQAAYKAAAKVLSTKPLYLAALKVGSFGMKPLCAIEESGQIGAKTAGIPLVKNWTESRNLDPLPATRFRTQFAKHKKESGEN
ncbi:MAG: LutB/LldF family L-lactate oxidation iron-sulfur protein [Eggerthellales bacterium]|nr:LutB/LldF family L-lactate oxidation iron-sulfur protein [Eggerthellales bacterium]